MSLYNPNVLLIKKGERTRERERERSCSSDFSRDERGKQNRLRGKLFNSQEPQSGRAIDSEASRMPRVLLGNQSWSCMFPIKADVWLP